LKTALNITNRYVLSIKIMKTDFKISHYFSLLVIISLITVYKLEIIIL